MEEQHTSESEQKGPRVSVFGRDMHTDRWECDGHCRKRRHDPVGGAIVLLLGILLLMSTLGFLPWGAWSTLWHLWPVVLVLVGVRMILGGSMVGRLIGGMLALTIVGVTLMYVLYKNGFSMTQYVPPEMLGQMRQFENQTTTTQPLLQ